MGRKHAALALFLGASPISFCPVRAHPRLGACCKSLVVKAEWHIPAYTPVQGPSPASPLKNSSTKASGREDKVVTCGPGSPQDSHCCQNCWCSLPTGVPGEDPRRAHVVCGTWKDTRQLLSMLSAPLAPFPHLGWGLRVPDYCR